MILKKIKHLVKKIIFYFYKIYISYHYKVKFKEGVDINLKSFFEGHNAIFKNTIFHNSYLGIGSYIANNSSLCNTKIGRFCAIGDNVRTCLGLHPSKNFVSIHPAFFSMQKQAGFTFVEKQLFEEHKYVDENKKYVVEIGNDVWIGNNVTIMDGITIGNGAIIAAGTVVTKDIESYTIVGGVPAKEIKKRFNKDDIEFLLDFQWWNKDINWILNNADLFSDIKKFLIKFNKNTNKFL